MVQRQWDAVSQFRSQITHKATLSLREASATPTVSNGRIHAYPWGQRTDALVGSLRYLAHTPSPRISSSARDTGHALVSAKSDFDLRFGRSPGQHTQWWPFQPRWHIRAVPQDRHPRRPSKAQSSAGSRFPHSRYLSCNLRRIAWRAHIADARGPGVHPFRHTPIVFTSSR